MNECEVRLALCGAAAGAAGTTALNAVTYIDRAIRGRPSSSTPETTVETLSSKTHVPIPGGEVARQNRVSGLGPLSGLLARGGTGALLRPCPGSRLASRLSSRCRRRHCRRDGRHQRPHDAARG